MAAQPGVTLMLGTAVCVLLHVLTPRADTPEPRTPEEYIFSYPCVGDHNCSRQLVISTGSLLDVTVNISYVNSSGDPEEVNHVLTNSTAARLLQPQCDDVIAIHSDDHIHVYAYQLCNSDPAQGTHQHPNLAYFYATAHRLRPVSQLGNMYVIMAPTALQTDPLTKSEITAVQNDTKVTLRIPPWISPSDLYGLKPANTSTVGREEVWTIQLDRLEKVTLKNNMTTQSGIEVESNKPLLVCSGTEAVSVENSHANYLWTGLDPASAWGVDYVTFPSLTNFSNIVDRYIFVAAENNMSIEITGDTNASIHMNKAFSSSSMNLSPMAFHRITSSKPVAVLNVAFSSSFIDHCFVTLTDLDRWSTTLTFATPNMSEWETLGLSRNNLTLFLTIVTDEASRNNITINGNESSITWTPAISGGDSSVIGGHVELSLSAEMYVLSSVTGTSRMAAYVTMMLDESPIGICFAVGGEGFQVYNRSFAGRYGGGWGNTGGGWRNTGETSENVYNITNSTMNTPGYDAATAITAAPSPQQPLKAKTHIQTCRCVKSEPVAAMSAAEVQKRDEAMAAAVREIRANLTVPKNNTGLALRQKTSAPDHRPSSAAMGSVAVVFFSLTLLTFVFLDLTRLVMWFSSLCSKANAIIAPE